MPAVEFAFATKMRILTGKSFVKPHGKRQVGLLEFLKAQTALHDLLHAIPSVANRLRQDAASHRVRRNVGRQFPPRCISVRTAQGFTFT